MKIIVEGTEIETRDIIMIKEAGWRMHGFIIQLTEDREIHVTQKEVYDTTIDEACAINDMYRALKEKVREQWIKDKNDIPTFSL